MTTNTNIETQLQARLDAVTAGTSDTDMLKLAKAAEGYTVDRTIFDAELQSRITALGVGNTNTELLKVAKTTLLGDVYQEVATISSKWRGLLKKGDKVYLGDGGLVPWDANLPDGTVEVSTSAALSNSPSQHLILSEGNYTNITDAGPVKCCRQLFDGGVLIITSNRNSAQRGDINTNLKVYKINKTTLAPTITTAILDSSSITGATITFLSRDASFEYFFITWTAQDAPSYLEVKVAKVDRSTGTITVGGAVTRAVASGGQNAINFVDKTNKLVYFEDNLGMYSCTYDESTLVAGTISVLVPATEYTAKGFPVDPEACSYFYQADSDIIYIVSDQSNVKSASGGTAYVGTIHKVTYDGSSFTSSLISEDRMFYRGFVSSGTQISGNCFSHIVTSWNSSYLDTLAFTDEGVTCASDTLSSLESLHYSSFYPVSKYASHALGGNYATLLDNYHLSFGAVGNKVFLHGETMDATTGEMGPGVDFANLTGALSREAYGSCNDTFSDYFGYLILDEDENYWYGIMRQGNNTNTAMSYRTFKYKKGTFIMSEGPIGRLLTEPDVNGVCTIERYKGGVLQGNTDTLQTYNGEYYPSVSLRGTFDYSHLKIKGTNTYYLSYSGVSSPTKANINARNVGGPIVKVNKQIEIDTSADLYLTEDITSIGRGKILVLRPVSNTSYTAHIEYEVGIL